MATKEFYVLSAMHTCRHHRYITLWAPDDCGYVYRISRAGRYTEERVMAHLGYYNSGSNIAVPVELIDTLTVMTTPADRLDGADGPAVLNTRAKWKILTANAIVKPQYEPDPEWFRMPHRLCRGI